MVEIADSECVVMKFRHFLIIALTILFAGATYGPVRAAHAQREILIKYKKGVEARARLKTQALGIKQIKNVRGIQMTRLKLPESMTVDAAIAKLKNDPSIEYVGPNHILRITAVYPNDPLFVTGYYDWIFGDYIDQWGLYNAGSYPRHDIRAPEAWAITTGSPSVVIAILDTGIDYTHPDLAPKIWKNTAEIPNNGIDDDNNGYIDDTRGWNFADYNNDPMDDNTDPYGFGIKMQHGSFTASIAGAATNNYSGMAGVAWGCPLMAVKVADALGYGLESDVAEGIIYAVDNGARVVNMSLAGDEDVPALAEAVDYAWERGVLCVAASGNENVGTDMYPAAYGNTLSVGASNENDQRCTSADWGAGGSNYGAYLDVVAPGKQIIGATSMLEENGYYYNDGTSAAAPFVAGVAALLWSAHPEWTVQKVFLQLTRTADDINPPGHDIYTGYGRVNAYRALTEEVQVSSTIAAAKSGAPGGSAFLSGVRLTTSSGDIANRLYVENEDRSSGILLYFPGSVPIGLANGDCVDVSGSTGLVSGAERAIMSPSITKRAEPNKKLEPLLMPNKTTGGGQFAGQVAVVDQYSYPRAMADGLNNIGLLVRTTGRVKHVGTNWFYIDDGSNLDDGTGYTGLYVDVGLSIVRPNIGKYVSVTGIITCEKLQGSPVARRVLRPRTQSDIKIR